MDYQKIIIAGNVTRNAEQQKSKKGDVDFTTFGVGVGDGKDKTTFFSVTVFGKLGKSIAEYVTKGRQVLVEGRIQVSEKGYFNVIADQVRLGSEPQKPAKKPRKKTKK